MLALSVVTGVVVVGAVEVVVSAVLIDAVSVVSVVIGVLVSLFENAIETSLLLNPGSGFLVQCHDLCLYRIILTF